MANANPAREKLLGFHGQPAARLSRFQSIYEPAQTSVWLAKFWILNTILVNAPREFLSEINTVVTDDQIQTPVWADFVIKARKKWTELTLYVRPHQLPLMDKFFSHRNKVHCSFERQHRFLGYPYRR